MHPRMATALNLWLITDRRWYKKSASLRSPETPVSLEPSSAIRLWASGLSGPMDSRANGTKWWLLDISRYFSVLRRAVWIAAAPAERPVMCRYERAKVSGAVTSQARHFPDLHGTKVQPSGRLPSARRRPVGYYCYYYYYYKSKKSSQLVNYTSTITRHRGRPLITSTIFCHFLTPPPCQQLSNIEGPPLNYVKNSWPPPPLQKLQKCLRTFFWRKTLLSTNFIVDVNFSWTPPPCQQLSNFFKPPPPPPLLLT